MENKKAHHRTCFFGKKRLTVQQEKQKDKEIDRQGTKETDLRGGRFKTTWSIFAERRGGEVGRRQGKERVRAEHVPGKSSAHV
ncbi:MAG: hypothetical protein D3903_02355 [Candidatus Electrothrix sp. GM3_4]|nr:hypothetical protein [Candidatus Electrothrix sp. GM3_4]